MYSALPIPPNVNYGLNSGLRLFPRKIPVISALSVTPNNGGYANALLVVCCAVSGELL